MKMSVVRTWSVIAIAAASMLMSACSIHVDDKDKKNEKVDIQTPLANLKVDTSDKAVDNGIPVYPGAHLRPADNDGDSHSANINLGAFGFGLKVIAAEYETPDSPEKVKAFYEDKMKMFGAVLTCTGHDGGSNVHINKHGDSDNRKLDCSDTHGSGWELKTGTSDDQHLVSIEPNGSGTRFGTVYIRTRGKDGDKETM